MTKRSESIFGGPAGIRLPFSYRGRTDGCYPSGRRVWLFVRGGWAWLHVEVGSRVIGWRWR